MKKFSRPTKFLCAVVCFFVAAAIVLGCCLDNIPVPEASEYVPGTEESLLESKGEADTRTEIKPFVTENNEETSDSEATENSEETEESEKATDSENEGISENSNEDNIKDINGPLNAGEVTPEETEEAEDETDEPATTPGAESFVTLAPAVTETPEITAVPTATPEPTPVVGIDYIDREEYVDFGVTYVPDETMGKGQYRVVSEGVQGIITKVYQFTVIDGVCQEDFKLVATKNTKAAVDKVVAYGTIDTFLAVDGNTYTYKQKIDGDATAYTDQWGGGSLVYGSGQLDGITTQWGVVAVDPSVIPIGTKLYVAGVNGNPDYGFAIAADTGGAIKNTRLDLWMDNAPLCCQWGVKACTIYILEDQSVDVFALRGDYEWEPAEWIKQYWGT